MELNMKCPSCEVKLREPYIKCNECKPVIELCLKVHAIIKLFCNDDGPSDVNRLSRTAKSEITQGDFSCADL